MTDQLPEKHAEAQAIVARLIGTGKHIDIELPATLDEQKAWALEKYDEHLKSGLQLGYALHVIRSQIETGEFGAWLDANSISRSTACNYIRIAKFVEKLDSSNVQRVAHKDNPNIDPEIEVEQEIDEILSRIIELPIRKQIELAKHTPDRIRAYFEGGLFDEIDDLNPSQIRTIIRQQKELESAIARNNRDEVRIKELYDENQQLKKMPEERRMMESMRRQLFADIETAQGIITRARKTFEMAKNFSQEVEHESIEAVVHPLIHMMSVLHGGAKLVADDCYFRWEIDPTIPVNPPMPNTLTHEEKWLAEESARFQAGITDSYLPKEDKKKGKK